MESARYRSLWELVCRRGFGHIPATYIQYQYHFYGDTEKLNELGHAGGMERANEDRDIADADQSVCIVQPRKS